MATPLSSPYPLTGDNVIDASTNGYYWQIGTDRTIRWSLSNGWSGEYWITPTAAAQQLSALFANISYYANVNFQYAGYFSSPATAANTSDINITFDAKNVTGHFASSSSWAFGDFPDASFNSWYQGAPGDIYVNANSDAASLPSYAPGTQGYFLYLHEILHTVGLKHPHDDGGTGRPTFQSLGWGSVDDDWFTVMSYRDDASWNVFGWDPATPMLTDVLALQYLYGRNMNTNAGDSTYALQQSNRYATIWDASGNDTVDASGTSTGWVIKLPNTQPTKLVDTKAGLAAPLVEYATAKLHTLYWLAGDIENVKGSIYADVISGTDGANSMMGNGGNDVIAGLGGDDTFVGMNGHVELLGGTGTDTLRLGLLSNQVTAYKLRENTAYVRDALGNSAITHDVERLAMTDMTQDIHNFSVVGNVDPSLIEIYIAAFRRAPELSGYNYWLAQEKAAGIRAVTQTIFSLDVVKSIYPTSMTDAAFVTAIYSNVFNRQPDQAGLGYWASQLFSHSRGDLVVDITAAALSVPDGTDGKEYFQNRVDWSTYVTAAQVIHNSEVSIATLTSMTATVGADPTTLLKIIAQSDGALYF